MHSIRRPSLVQKRATAFTAAQYAQSNESINPTLAHSYQSSFTLHVNHNGSHIYAH